MNAKTSRADVCVVGGGPAGLLLGLLLAKRGAKVIVLEGHPTFDREFRGEVLQPSTPRLLEQIGLLEYILEQPHLTLTSGTFLVDPPQNWARSIYFSVGGEVPSLLLPKYPDQIQVGLLFRKDTWKEWRKDGVAAVADRLRALSPLYAEFASRLGDFTPFFPLP